MTIQGARGQVSAWADWLHEAAFGRGPIATLEGKGVPVKETQGFRKGSGDRQLPAPPLSEAIRRRRADMNGSALE
jgi:hypothetical protein